ncbi:MAG: ferredoxin reductase [Frankiales bacterium]|nr:ferredoxin reductase [Frankiales bacterium]
MAPKAPARPSALRDGASLLRDRAVALKRLLATPAAELPAPVRVAEQQAAADPDAPRPPDAGLLRGLASRLTTPLLPDDYLHLLNPLWSARELRGVVVEVVPETEHAATLVIQPGWGWSGEYRAGQYIGIGVQVEGRWHWRSYSLTSVPTRGDSTISITVKAMPEGFLSQHLVGGLAPGTVMRLAAPKGDFVLPDPPPEKVLFLTGGAGLTPVMGMLRMLHRRGSMTDVHVVHSAPTEQDALFRDELHALAEEHDTLRLHEQFTETMGMLALERLDEVVPDWVERETWACGPPPMLDAAERVWKAQHLTGKLHVERFSIQLDGAGGEGGTVTFGAGGRTAEVDGATTLLEAGEQVGVQMPFGCRMGICQSCVVPLVAGSVRDLRNGTVHVEGDRVQTCVSAAAGDCVLGV